MPKPEELLAAGAFLSIKEKLKNDATVDSVSARVYEHPALGNRPVVRLTADNLAEGDDLTMEFLGFGAPKIIGPVAKRQRQALGFPGWALINDPKHARYALELVKEFKKAVRKAKAKPGHGYDEFVEISKRLGKSVAHFLPSFWEQVGREFIAFDNATYASRAFGKAREAEKVHALKVDESIRQDAFLEFALAGAVSIKALTEYGKELSSTHDPISAWTFLRELCVRRTLGGMPPWTSMLKDIQPLIKAAKLDQEKEVHSILLEIIDSPAISRASMGFWDSVAKDVGSLAAKNSHVAGVLLNMIPQKSDWQTNDLWPWLDHLDSWGILANGWKDDVPEEARPNGGPAAWLGRLIQSGRRLRQKMFDIVEAMAPRLRKDGVPINPYQKHRWGNQIECDVDLLDFLLEQKIPIIEPAQNLELDLGQWAQIDQGDKSAKNRPRDPVHVVADHRFARSLKETLNNVAGTAEFEAAAAGKSALREARRDWLSSLVDGLTSGALPGIELSLDMIRTKTGRSIFQEFPEVLEKLKSVDPLIAVTRTIQHGIMDEYGWPQLERVCDDFAAAGHPKPLLYGQFPNLIVTDGLKAVVLRGNAIVHEAELRLPQGHKLEQLMYVDGDLIVWSGVGYQDVCFWNSNPQPGDPEYYYHHSGIFGVAIDAPGGGTVIDQKIVHKGDKIPNSLRATDHVLSDGNHWWIRSGEYDTTLSEMVHSIHELDPVTGKKGRRSMPSFFEDFIEDGWTLDLKQLSLLPLGAVFPNSLLGSKGGMIGYRQRHNALHAVQIEGIDGRSVETSDSNRFSALLNQSATKKFLPVEPVAGYPSPVGFKLWDPSGAFEIAEIRDGVGGYNRGQAAYVPWVYLHGFEVRDPAASTKLRAVTNDDVRLLMEAERQDTETFQNHHAASPKTSNRVNSARKETSKEASTSEVFNDDKDYSLLDAAIHKLIGTQSSPRLRIGLRAIISRAGQQTRRLKTVIEKRSAATPSQETLVPASDDLAAEQFAKLIGAEFCTLRNLSYVESLTSLVEFFDGTKSITHFAPQWLDLLRAMIKGLPQRIWSGYCTDPTNQKWIPFAELWCRSSFHNLRGSFRMFLGTTTNSTFLAAEIAAVNDAGKPPKEFSYDGRWPIPVVGKSSRFLISQDYRGYTVVEYSLNGQFEGIPDLVEVEGTSFIAPSPIWTVEQLCSFVQLAKTNQLNIPRVELLKEIAERVHVSMAEVALVWFGLPNFNSYSANFMPAHLREACKLKARDCAAAKEALNAMPDTTLSSLVRTVIDGDPADLWEVPPNKVAERLQRAWSQQENRLPLSAEWMEKMADSFGYGIDKQKFFRALNAPLSDPMFSDQAKWTLGNQDKGDHEQLSCDEEISKTFTQATLCAATISIAMLAYGLPVGDPARDQMCDVLKATHAALANPELILTAGRRYDHDPKNSDRSKVLIESVIGKVQVVNGHSIADDGTVGAVLAGISTVFAIRPANLQSETQLKKVWNQMISLATPESYVDVQLIQQLRLVRSAEFCELVDRIKNTPVPVGSYETNPKLSAPEIVKQAMKKLKLSEDAAVYYLQLLALPDPTDKYILLWNDWTTAAIKQVAKQLVDKGLALEASRSRAGRKIFLPGGWEDLKAPHLPLETWKLPLLQMVRDANQRATPPLSRILPLEPVHRLFAKAWKRIADGDIPKYEEVQ